MDSCLLIMSPWINITGIHANATFLKRFALHGYFGRHKKFLQAASELENNHETQLQN